MEKIKNFLADKRWFAVVMAIILLGIILSIMSPAFLQVSNLRGVLVQSSVTCIMSVGLTFVILTAGIDISIGSILFLSATIFATTLQMSGNFMLALLSSLVIATLAGVLNGFLVYKFDMAPMITTLATYNIYRGLAIHISGASNIPVPRELCFLGNGKLIGIPIPLIILLVIFVVGVYAFKNTRFGTFVRAIGDSAESAAESNLPVKKTTIIAYTAAGLTAGIGGIILLSRVGGLQSGLGIGMDFTVIAAVVLGGTKLSGGSGSVIGSVLGAIFLVLIDNGLNLMHASPYIYDAVRGGVLIFAVVVDRLSYLRQIKTAKEQKEKRIKCSA
jgi:ribose transport system permease protein